jgi:multiple sugar transport system permease protein
MKKIIAPNIIIFILILFAITPIFFAILGSFKELKDIVTPIPKIFFNPTLENYITVLTTDSILKGIKNSTIIVGISLLIGILVGIPASYAIARYNPKGSDDLRFFYLSIRFMPPVAIAIPFIGIFLDLGLYDTKIAIIITYLPITISSIIWLSIPAFERVPREIEEAASIDGYSYFSIFRKIALPIASPSLIGAIIFTFVITWNELLIALSLSSKNVTLPVVAASFTSLGFETPWGVINASAILLAIPPLLFVFIIIKFIKKFIAKE